jgi:hypothetical protein
MRLRALGLYLASILLATNIAASDDQHSGHMVAGKVGTVTFPVSCSAAAQKAFPRAVALLHSFAYEQALGEFTTIARQDPKCAMAY